MELTREDYQRLLLQLLPEGPVWPRDLDTVIATLLGALAETLVRIDQRAADVRDEMDPRTVSELLTDWERNFGLPDKCVSANQTLQERRNALVGRITSMGGQSRAFFISLAAALGYSITITEFFPFRTGAGRVGTALNSEEWRNVWRVNAPDSTVISFRAGVSGVGEPLRKWGNELLECVFNRIKPAHTLLLFGYGELSYVEHDFLEGDYVY